MPNAVSASDLRKVFHVRGRRGSADHVAVDSVSFEVESGRCLGIVGESGSGKTTLARMIVGLESPTSGSISVCDVERSAGARTAKVRREWARRVQMVFQDPYTSLDGRQTGVDCLDETLRLHFDLASTSRAARIRELADQVGLTEKQVGSRPSQLSGGQRQRLAIARALAVEPEVLVLDESVSALDVSVQAQVLNCLTDIQRELGVTYLFVSHDLGVIRQMADEVIVMLHGSVVESGPAASVLDSPAHAYTQRLKACVPGPGWRPPGRGKAAAPY